MPVKQLIVNETFLSIQGESTQAGRLCFFIRLAGCNLNCGYCDTDYARDTESGTAMTIAHLVSQARLAKVRLVEITGGEPLNQVNTAALCEALLDEDIEVMVETNGSLPLSLLPPAVRKIVDCKTPSSGMDEYNLYDNFHILSNRDEIKFVICDYADYEFALAVMERYQLAGKTPNILFSPAWGKLDPKTLAGWMLADLPPARLQLQIHKLIWGPDKCSV
ncbi:MAG: radical SAM protein [Victivallaceae bacterium]|nr:radical SAM protein [Victivallaceae bacterium]